MKKINGGYTSLFEYLVFKHFPFAEAIDRRFYPIENSNISWVTNVPYGRRYNETPKGKWTDQFIGALQPIASMANDFQYTFKPYKSVREFLLDIGQPIRGVGNILRGLMNLIGAPLLFIGNSARYALTADSFGHFVTNMKLNLIRTTSWFIDGLSSLIRGSTQLVTFPLTWGIRIPLRGMITCVLGSPDIIENEEIQRLVLQGKEAVRNRDGYWMDCISHKLHEEYQKSIAHGQHSKLSSSEEKQVFGTMSFTYGRNWIKPMPKSAKAHSITYLGLFKKQAEFYSTATKLKLSMDERTDYIIDLAVDSI